MDYPKEFIADKIRLVNSLKLERDKEVTYTSGNVKVKFRYTHLDTMMNAVKNSAEFAAKFCITFDCECEAVPQENIIIISVAAVLTHISGYVERSPKAKWILPCLGKDGKPVRQQDQGAAISYCKRYALGAMLGVSSDEDSDGNTDQEPQTVRKAAPAAKQQAKAAPASPAPTSAPAAPAPAPAPSLWTEEQKQQLNKIKNDWVSVYGFSADTFIPTVKEAFGGRLPWAGGDMTAEDAEKLLSHLIAVVEEYEAAESLPM